MMKNKNSLDKDLILPKTDGGLILPKTDIMLSSSSFISEICKPLRKLGITSFSYTRVYEDGTFMDLSDNCKMLDFFYYKSDLYKYYTPDVNPSIIGDGFFLLKSLGENKCTEVMREELDIDNVMVFVNKHRKFYEVFNFASCKGNDSIVSLYFHNSATLKDFTFYFRDKAFNLIKEFEKDKIIRQQLIIDNKYNNYNISINILENLSIDRFYIGDKYNSEYLTYKEAVCIYWCSEGKSVKEIADILSMSEKIVQDHLEKSKLKLKAFKQTDLIRKATELGIVQYMQDAKQE